MFLKYGYILDFNLSWSSCIEVLVRVRFRVSFWRQLSICQTCYWICVKSMLASQWTILTGDPLHSRAHAHSRAPLFTQPCPHCSHSSAPGEQWARLCVFTLQGCVQAARLCRGSSVILGCEYVTTASCAKTWKGRLDHLKTVTFWRRQRRFELVCIAFAQLDENQ